MLKMDFLVRTIEIIEDYKRTDGRTDLNYKNLFLNEDNYVQFVFV